MMINNLIMQIISINHFLTKILVTHHIILEIYIQVSMYMISTLPCFKQSSNSYIHIINVILIMDRFYFSQPKNSLSQQKIKLGFKNKYKKRHTYISFAQY